MKLCISLAIVMREGSMLRVYKQCFELFVKTKSERTSPIPMITPGNSSEIGNSLTNLIDRDVCLRIGTYSV